MQDAIPSSTVTQALLLEARNAQLAWQRIWLLRDSPPCTTPSPRDRCFTARRGLSARNRTPHPRELPSCRPKFTAIRGPARKSGETQPAEHVNCTTHCHARCQLSTHSKTLVRSELSGILCPGNPASCCNSFTAMVMRPAPAHTNKRPCCQKQCMAFAHGCPVAATRRGGTQGTRLLLMLGSPQLHLVLHVAPTRGPHLLADAASEGLTAMHDALSLLLAARPLRVEKNSAAHGFRASPTSCHSIQGPGLLLVVNNPPSHTVPRRAPISAANPEPLSPNLPADAAADAASKRPTTMQDAIPSSTAARGLAARSQGCHGCMKMSPKQTRPRAPPGPE